MATANIGPFKYIGAVNFPGEDEPDPHGPGSEGSIGVTIYFTRLDDDSADGWNQVFSDTFDGAAYGESNVAVIDNPMSPETIAVPDVITEGPFWDASAEMFYDTKEVVTGLVPHAPSEASGDFVYFTEPNPRFTTSGSTATVRKWKIKYKRYFFFLGIHHHELVSLEELGSETFDCSGVVWHSTDGVYYHATHFNVSNRIVGIRQT